MPPRAKLMVLESEEALADPGVRLGFAVVFPTPSPDLHRR